MYPFFPLSTRSRQRTVSFSSGVSNMDILYRTQKKWRQLARESGRKREDTRNKELEMIEKFCEIDPMEFFAFPSNDPPPPPLPLELEIYPTFAEFIEMGGASKHVITNKGTQRIVWKVRCSNNSLFKVLPVFAFLDPSQSMDLHIVRYEGPVRKDKLVIMYKEAKAEETDPKKSFLIEGVTCKMILPMITREIDAPKE
ncbi:hypothetical protein PMAYCL1PPCAC_12566 [Pristionchus mayeri]|uniref:Major sperm protein n=1 Tax=Pristionchus mayeri TaxID=1317129 RepID=A0AAN4ZNV5_9BILA|nr:hypothetical protein PMAYCL1PPCAC_12566 [Pristionchus mayeri]